MESQNDSSLSISKKSAVDQVSIIIYHNPDCETSCNVLQFLHKAGFDPIIVEYLKVGWTREKIVELLSATGLSVRAILRETKSPAAELGLLNSDVSDDVLLDMMLKHPILVNRPIVVTPVGTKLCRPSESVLNLISTLQRNNPTVDPSLSTISSISTRTPIKIAVGSKNPIKIKAAINGIQQALQYPLNSIENMNLITAEGFDVPSGVPDQPNGSDETKRGATTRAIKAWDAYMSLHSSPPSYSIGLEGGIEDVDGTMECAAWMVIYNGSKFGSAKTCSFTVPPKMAALVRGGMELGVAHDSIFDTVNSKQKSGTVGHLTRGVVDRSEYYRSAVLLAMIPFLWPELYT